MSEAGKSYRKLIVAYSLQLQFKNEKQARVRIGNQTKNYYQSPSISSSVSRLSYKQNLKSVNNCNPLNEILPIFVFEFRFRSSFIVNMMKREPCENRGLYPQL